MMVNQKIWSCPKKLKARTETIISQYQQKLEHKSLPPNKQYWTMCGQCATSDGQQLTDCEPDQLIKSGLIQPEQFRGVEINSEIHALNVQAFPELTWINDDFYRAMVDFHSMGEFNPGVVNADFPATPDGAAGYISRVLSFLSSTSDEVLFVVNLIFRMRYYSVKDGDYVMKLLNEFPQFRFAMRGGDWGVSDECYIYNGAGQTGSRTYMGSLIFIKKHI